MGLSAARRPCLLGLAHVWLWVAPRTPKISRGADTPLRAQRGAEAQAPASAKAADPAASIPARRERDSDSDLFVLLYLLWLYFLWLYLLGASMTPTSSCSSSPRQHAARRRSETVRVCVT